HFVIGHAIVGGALAIVDPGNVLYTAAHGGKGSIQNWQSVTGYLDAGANGENAAKVRMPATSQWSGGSAPGQEGDWRAYNLVSGQFLDKILGNLISLTSLTYPDGAKLGGATPTQAQSQQTTQTQSQQ